LEEEINELVYQIYGITKEEKEIIESNLWGSIITKEKFK
jgi:hypothetical protein